ncbi:sialidase/neuraminidase [Xanthomonas translucens pv. poae]|uniref:Sialidase/neuraminidase n=1 Tax=Xanthomonas graminis pv. poae TaxID=227946 RepID=A0A0K3A4P1_9XANT|nr:sialidase family protein [Xanthomonas translucens]UKE63074.1 exo-alpha-sialidase [Xanthomonas translucens pv. poae]CTP93126.1 sialidase/neuraminidase [Xanthomonas translucens pv. poae]
MMRPSLLPLLSLFAVRAIAAPAPAPAMPAAGLPSPIVYSEFVNADAPTAQCHASTLLETRDGLLAAWFGGRHEGADDVGIWVARRGAQGWQPAQRVADGKQPQGAPLPAWNPVLFQPAKGPLRLFYKVGPDPKRWWGMQTTSRDGGVHWSAPERLPDGILGPIKNKPVQLADGRILSPSSSEDAGWVAHMEWSDDNGAHWTRGPALNDPARIGAIQPSVLVHTDGRVQAIGRSQQNHVFSTWSRDHGRSWAPMTLLDLANPNSGTDAVVLADGRSLLVYNPTEAGKDWWDGRGTLAVALSADGNHWTRVLTLEDSAKDEFSYPAVIQTGDGLVHISYTWKRTHIKHVVLDPARLGRGASTPAAR